MSAIFCFLFFFIVANGVATALAGVAAFDVVAAVDETVVIFSINDNYFWFLKKISWLLLLLLLLILLMLLLLLMKLLLLLVLMTANFCFLKTFCIILKTFYC